MQQLDLFAASNPEKAKNSLFLALFPDREAVTRICDVATGIQSRHGLKSKLRPPDHFHITLHWLGDFPNVPARLIEGVHHACETMVSRVSSFEVTLDRVVSFGDALVLKGNHEISANPALMELEHALSLQLVKNGVFNPKSPKFSPHLTLLYDRRHLAEEAVKPLKWIAQEMVLIQSKIGLTEYHRLGQWRLGTQF